MCEKETKKKFNAIDGETLMDMNLPRTKFVIQGILPQGLAIIAGAPKIGKFCLYTICVSRMTRIRLISCQEQTVLQAVQIQYLLLTGANAVKTVQH